MSNTYAELEARWMTTPDQEARDNADSDFNARYDDVRERYAHETDGMTTECDFHGHCEEPTHLEAEPLGSLGIYVPCGGCLLPTSEVVFGHAEGNVKCSDCGTAYHFDKVVIDLSEDCPF